MNRDLTGICDRCGRPLTAKETRYVVRLEVFAAADPLVVDEAELRRDHRLRMEHLIEQAEAMTEEELMQDVYVERHYVLCRRCQQAWLRNPLGATDQPPPPAPDV